MAQGQQRPTSTPLDRGAVDAVARAVAGQARRDGLTGRSRTAGSCDPGLALIPEHAPASLTVHAIYRSSAAPASSSNP
jgi:hypothetical protein